MVLGWLAGGLSAALIALAAALAAFARSKTRARDPEAHDADAAEALQDRLWHVAESEDRYRTLVEATTEVIVQRDAKGRITFVNDGYARLLGAKALELIGSTAQLAVLECGAVTVRPDGVRQIEERVRLADGTLRWFSYVEMPVQGEGGPHWLRAGSDVTARVEAARALDEAKSKAEAANIAKSRFLATVSHEFRTPLNGILGMADLVMETKLDAEQRTYVEAVRTSGTALLTLIDGILDFSRIEAGKLDLVAEPFDVATLVEGVVELLAPRAQDKGLEIALDVADDVEAMRVGDADRLRQILLNLAGNAVKFTQAGGVGVTLTCGDDGLVFAIEDTGPGIPEERIPALFEEFAQGDDSASRRHEGTGLGLAITRRLVERMNGRIEASATLGRGSIFRVTLPLPRAAQDGAAATARVALGQRKILIVADSPFQAPYLARRLARGGAAAVIVPDVEAGLTALADASFDAVIADRCLGEAAVRALGREAKRCGVRCSLVLLSPFDRREIGPAGAAGFDSYLIKPVRARSLFDRLLEPRWVRSGPAGTTQAPRLLSKPLALPPGRRVLLAEDNPINALLASKALERLGASVVQARDGLEAVAAVETEEAFDLALIDIRMPGLDGLETARRIRVREAATGAPPLHLVALTANTGAEDERAARAAGFDGFLAKPLDLKALRELLEQPAKAA